MKTATAALLSFATLATLVAAPVLADDARTFTCTDGSTASLQGGTVTIVSGYLAGSVVEPGYWSFTGGTENSIVLLNSSENDDGFTECHAHQVDEVQQ